MKTIRTTRRDIPSLCTNCGGTGKVQPYMIGGYTGDIRTTCPVCLGSGQIIISETTTEHTILDTNE